MKISSLVLLLCLFSTVVIAQRRPTVEPRPPAILTPSVSSAQQREVQLRSLKKPGHYTAKDWGHLIDSLWGDGMSTTEKLSIFDRYWNLVDQTWGGFPNLVVNWDSLKNVYRPLVEAGVSRGRFYGILSRLTRALNEWHVFTKDRGIDATMGFYEDLEVDAEYPNYPSFHYRPGLPIIYANNLFFRTYFGAGLTPLPDSTAVVYRVMPNHPLNLQPGDVILGYDGIPWKDLVQELLDAELPILGGGNMLGSSPASGHHAAMMSVGMNWGLFDTIDVVKYTTKDTLHFPTSLLDTIAQPYFVATEQLPVNGVPLPDIDSKKLVSWGIVEGTAIGYVYAWDWYGMPYGETRTLFTQAVDELVHQEKVEGLILDFRTNAGGNPEFANNGYKHLFNFDPTLYYSQASRVRGGPRLSFTLTPKYLSDVFSPGPELFDHPIAVLTGPMAGSSGDYNAFKMRFHPMARFFGKRTNGAYTAFTAQVQYGVLAGSYFCRVDDASVYSNFNDEGFMIHKGFPVDEEVWLTRDGVAKGEDDVVKRALRWMNTLSYAHDVVVIKDNVTITPAAKGVMYAASDTLYTIETQTGAATQIGWIGPTLMTSLAIRPSTREMYGASTSSSGTVLYRVSASAASRLTAGHLADSIRITAKVENPEQHALVVSAIITNAQGALVDSVVFSNTPGDSVWRAVISTPSIRGTYDVNVRTEDATAGSYRRLPNVTSFTVAQTNVERTIPIPNMRAIAFDRDGTLYGATMNGRLYRITPSTADTFYIGTAVGIAYSSMAFQPSTGELWASARPAVSGRDRIYKVNTTTGDTTLVGATGGGRITPAIAFSQDDVLYGLKIGSVSDTLITISTDNATATAVGLTGVRGLNALAMLTDTTSVAVDEHKTAQTPVRFSLAQNYPNPFNPSTTIKYELPKSSMVKLIVYDLLGREASLLVNERRDVGVHEVKFDGSNLASGVYLYRLTAGEFTQTRKLILVH